MHLFPFPFPEAFFIKTHALFLFLHISFIAARIPIAASRKQLSYESSHEEGESRK